MVRLPLLMCCLKTRKSSLRGRAGRSKAEPGAAASQVGRLALFGVPGRPPAAEDLEQRMKFSP